VTVAHGALDRLDHVRRRLESEGNRVPDIEIADCFAGRFNLSRLRDDIADGVDEAADAARDGNRGGRTHAEKLIRRAVCKNVSAPAPQARKFYSLLVLPWFDNQSRDHKKYHEINNL
jgi:hypothetical protein